MPDKVETEDKIVIENLGDGASLAECLQPRHYIDSDHPRIVEFARDAIGASQDRVEQAVKLYYAVRDLVRYDPYNTPLRSEAYKASTCVMQGYGYCVTKAALMAATARAVGIPARVGFADVRNHMTTKRLTEYMGTDIFYYHGYADLWLDGKWVKATPAFNKGLTDKFRLKSLEFDGRADSIYHPYDLQGQRHMEYLRYHGAFVDVPFATIRETFLKVYPGMPFLSGEADQPVGDFAQEAEAENAA
jgi:transglutaminase-like putative cysteine protease